MKKHSTQDNRKLKLNKIKKAKRRKNKMLIAQRLREKPAVIIPVSFNYPLNRTRVSLLGILAVISYLFLVHPVYPLQSGTQCERSDQTMSVAETSYIPSANLFENTYPKPNGESYDQILSIVKNTPMEKMASLISQKDRRVAAFMVGIAMKESKYGKYSPKKNGKDCYNYWGYRGKENTTQSGYSCFKNPEQAVQVVGGRIESLVKKGVKTPNQMIVWKCGSTCNGHSPESVAKWISDVSLLYNDISRPVQVARTFTE